LYFFGFQIQKRFEGYQKICFYGLGSAFMGAATGVLDNMQETHPEWAHWGSFCFAVSLANAEWLVCYELSTACSVGWWLVLICSERRVLLAGCGWLLVAGSF
jgi:hypothetical protein